MVRECMIVAVLFLILITAGAQAQDRPILTVELATGNWQAELSGHLMTSQYGWWTEARKRFKEQRLLEFRDFSLSDLWQGSVKEEGGFIGNISFTLAGNMIILNLSYRQGDIDFSYDCDLVYFGGGVLEGSCLIGKWTREQSRELILKESVPAKIIMVRLGR